ncbi:MAG TPA: sulfotransferase [Pirellulales bacterium]|jgi:tetratricopeptide (TPR) repeat protein|nr:sulfotransferase [Pirellulales bacterium]
MTTASQPPDLPAGIDLLFELALHERRAGRLEEAAAAYRRVLAIRPNLAEAHVNLGNVLTEQRKLDDAAAQYKSAIALNPNLFQACNNLGNILREQGELEQALAHYHQAIALNPDYADAHNNVAGVLRSQGKLAEAVERYQHAIALRPDFADAHNNLAGVLKQLGRFDEALAHYDRALALRPDFVQAHYRRTDLKTFRAGDADLAALEALAADTARLPRHRKPPIHFALAKALEDVGDYPRAFEQWLRGNALKRSQVNYDEASCQRGFRAIADLFDANLLARARAPWDLSPVPIFIVGMPRSGSTLVEQILASHPQVDAGGELKNLERVVRATSDPGGWSASYPALIQALDADGLRRLGQAYLASLPALSDGKTHITDKLPGNFLRIGLIHLILPGARIIHTVRDPVDTCVSCFTRLFADVPFSYDLAELGRHFRCYHELMEHWRRVLPAGSVLDVAYEDLVDDLETHARRLIEHCGLAWDDRCLSFHETSRPIATPSNVQARQPLYRSSVGRWRRYEAYLQPLLAEIDDCRSTE